MAPEEQCHCTEKNNSKYKSSRECLCWLKDLFSVTYFANDRLKNSVWFTVFSKKHFFVKRGICRSMESVCLLQDNILLLTSWGEEVARVRYQEVNYSHTARAHTHTHIYIYTVYIYIYTVYIYIYACKFSTKHPWCRSKTLCSKQGPL